MKTAHKKTISKHIKNTSDDISFFDIVRRFFVVWLLMFFCALLITQQESFWIKVSQNSPEQAVFVLPGTPADWGIEGNSGVHGAASDWSYLFEDENLTGSQNNQSSTNITGNSDLPIELTPTNQNTSIKDQFPMDDPYITDEGSGGTIISGDMLTGENLLSGNINTGSESVLCITPWGERLAEGDFVLAYEQRKDVTNVCNVQRRYCNNGKLSGTYSQKSCKENTIYSYVKPEAVSYNQQKPDPFVQPDEPSLSGANFDNHGKINGSTAPIDTWGDAGYIIDSGMSVKQTAEPNIQCVTPRGEIVKNGQFVKAYKSSIGLIDLPCDVEIRLCVKGKLKGTYTNRTCAFKNITYRDYMTNNYNNKQATIGDLANSINTDEANTTYQSSSFWKWLEKYF